MTKFLLAILLGVGTLFGQSVGMPNPNLHSHHPFPGGNWVRPVTVVVNTQFSVALPTLAGETGCSLQVFGRPMAGAPGWALSANTLSGTPTQVGFYRLLVTCTTPNAVKQSVMLNVLKTAPPVNPTPAPGPTPIPLN